MDSIMANIPKVNLLESPTVEDSDTERLDVVMVSAACAIELHQLPWWQDEVDKMKKQRKELVSKLREQVHVILAAVHLLYNKMY